jgi:hypothetical protein
MHPENHANAHRPEPDGRDLRALFAELSRGEGAWHNVLKGLYENDTREDERVLDRYLSSTYRISQGALNLDAAVSGRGNHRSALAFHLSHERGSADRRYSDLLFWLASAMTYDVTAGATGRRADGRMIQIPCFLTNTLSSFNRRTFFTELPQRTSFPTIPNSPITNKMSPLPEILFAIPRNPM